MTIRITAKREGFRRCGIAHTMAAVEYQDDQFTGEQLAYLQAEPMLVVEIIKGEPDRPGKRAGSETPNAGDTIALVKAAADLFALEILATGEERKSVLAAIAAKRTELTQAE